MPSGTIAIERMGVRARAFVDTGDRATVAALFERSFYLAAGGAYFCVGTADIGDGPLNAICNLAGDLDWHDHGVTDGAGATFDGSTIRLENGPLFEFCGAQTWLAAPWPLPPTESQLADTLGRLRALAETSDPKGFAAIALGQMERGDSIARALQRAGSLHMAGLQDWLDVRLAGEGAVGAAGASAVRGLLGLGAGLTPSGDDVLAGALIGLHALRRPDVAAALWAHIETAPRNATSALSRVLLQIAADGEPSAVVHATVFAILEGRQAAIEAHFRGLVSVGHSSGWDMLAGLMMALDAATVPKPLMKTR